MLLRHEYEQALRGDELQQQLLVLQLVLALSGELQLLLFLIQLALAIRGGPQQQLFVLRHALALRDEPQQQLLVLQLVLALGGELQLPLFLIQHALALRDEPQQQLLVLRLVLALRCEQELVLSGEPLALWAFQHVRVPPRGELLERVWAPQRDVVVLGELKQRFILHERQARRDLPRQPVRDEPQRCVWRALHGQRLREIRRVLLLVQRDEPRRLVLLPRRGPAFRDGLQHRAA